MLARVERVCSLDTFVVVDCVQEITADAELYIVDTFKLATIEQLLYRFRVLRLDEVVAIALFLRWVDCVSLQPFEAVPDPSILICRPEQAPLAHAQLAEKHIVFG